MVDVEVKKVRGGFDGLIKRLNLLKKRHIYVGVPQEKASRQSGEINNAELVYIHTHGIRRKSMREEMKKNMAKGMKYSKAYELYIASHGSPLWHAPPRPIIEPAIEANKERISKELSKLYQAANEGNGESLERAIRRVGLLAQNKVRAWFTDPQNGWAPNSPKTIHMKGSSKPLIDTGNLRKSIVYVVRKD